jgi:hypothetical protein
MFSWVRDYRNGELIETSRNPEFNGTPDRLLTNRTFIPRDQAYDPQMDFAYAHVGNFVLPACLSRALCNSYPQHYFSATIASPAPACSAVRFDRMPVKNYFAQLMQSVLFSTDP